MKREFIIKLAVLTDQYCQQMAVNLPQRCARTCRWWRTRKRREEKRREEKKRKEKKRKEKRRREESQSQRDLNVPKIPIHTPELQSNQIPEWKSVTQRLYLHRAVENKPRTPNKNWIKFQGPNPRLLPRLFQQLQVGSAWFFTPHDSVSPHHHLMAS